MTTATETYWASVLGDRTPAQVVREFELVETGPGLDEWLGAAEVEAQNAGAGLTDEQLEVGHAAALAALSREIGAGDLAMVAVCDRAEAGDPVAIAEVARCEVDARAQLAYAEDERREDAARAVRR